MVRIVLGTLVRVKCGDRVCNKIYIDDVHVIARTQWKRRQSCEEHKGAYHVELRSLGAATVTKHDAGSENCLWYVGQKLTNHVLAEFFCARVGIVVRAVPVDGIVFGDHFILALSRHRDRAHMAET